MALIIPAIRGRLGETEYYESTMKARDFVQAVRPPRELDEWASFSIEERMQRDPNTTRILGQIAPYIANNRDRFFGSIIVLTYDAKVTFEPMTKFADGLPAAYAENLENMGFLTIGGGTLVVLDGQHRYLAMRLVLQGEVEGPAAKSLSNDDVSVIFVPHQDSMKTRRIFNVVNRYAKPTGRGDNIITSEDDGYAIVARRLLSDDQPLGRTEVGREELVDWKSNTLGTRSIRLTTISAVYDSVKLILEARGAPKLDTSTRPADAELAQYVDLCASVWWTVLQGMDPYRQAVARPREIPNFRKDEHRFALLFKPAAQIAVLDGLLRAESTSGRPLADIVARANRIGDWSMDSRTWRGIIVKSTGAIDAGTEARRRMAAVLEYMLARESLQEPDLFGVWRMFNESRGHRLEVWVQSAFVDAEGLEPLPQPVEGARYAVEDARVYASTATQDA